MATLIQSKQIQGIVTASVIEGDFAISGSLNVSGSGIFTNDITASGVISASQILGVKYEDIEGTPNFIGGSGILISQTDNDITITNTGGGGGVSGSAELIASVALLNSYTASTDIRLDGLSSQTGSYLTSLPTGLVSGSDQLTSSYDQRYALSGSIGGGSTDISSLNDYTSSTDSRLTNIETFTSSIESRVSTLEGQTDNTGSDAQTLSIVGDQLSISDGNTVTIPTGSGGGTSDFTELTNVPSGLVSGSEQVLGGTGILSGSHTDISSLNNFTSSIQSQVDGLSQQTSSYLTELPSGVTSGSILPGSNVTIDSSSGDYIISASIPGGGDTSYDGDRIVSNTLFGDLYSQSFNAGTSGSIQDFLDAVFFPQTAPTAEFTDQTANFNTNLATNNTNLVSVALTDTVDNSPYTLVLSGTGASSLTAVPTNAESSSWELRANGDLSAGTYSYDVTVGDSTNSTRVYSGRSITIAQADTGTLTPNGTFYIIESATNGDFIRTNSNGFSGGQGQVSVSYSPNYGSQTASNFQSSNPLISINSSTRVLTVGTDISGSGNTNGDTITSTISWEDQYGNNGSDTITVNVTENTSPDIVFTNSSLLNTNQATGSSGTLVTISFTDTESDSINHDTFQFTDPSGQLQSTKSGETYLVTATSDLSASNYTITCSVEDIHGFSTTTETHTFSISQADNGTLGGDTSIYILESAVSGDSFRDATGFGNGNPANISVTYSPNYGSQTATLSSSNPAISVDGSGNLTLGVDLSGSVTQSGDTFTSTISWEDQYGNTDSGTVTATVFGNQSPSATFVDNGLTDVTGVSGSNAATITITDTESNTPFSASIGGTDGGKFNLVPQNSNSSSYEVQPTGSLSIGDYSVQVVITDSYSETATLNETISVTSDSDFGVTYIYTSTRVGGGTLSPANYLSIMGGSGVNGEAPPQVTSFTADAGSPFIKLVSGSLGDSTISVTGGTMTLRAAVSGSDLTDIITGSFSGDGVAQEMFFIAFPSGSDMVGTPTSMTDSLGGSTSGEYVVYGKAAGESSFTVIGTTIHSLQFNSEKEGYSKWNIIGRTGPSTAASYELRLIPSSGSAPS